MVCLRSDRKEKAEHLNARPFLLSGSPVPWREWRQVFLSSAFPFGKSSGVRVAYLPMSLLHCGMTKVVTLMNSYGASPIDLPRFASSRTWEVWCLSLALLLKWTFQRGQGWASESFNYQLAYFCIWVDLADMRPVVQYFQPQLPFEGRVYRWGSLVN